MSPLPCFPYHHPVMIGWSTWPQFNTPGGSKVWVQVDEQVSEVKVHAHARAPSAIAAIAVVVGGRGAPGGAQEEEEDENV